MSKNGQKEDNWFVPLILAIVLAILVILLFIGKELKKKPEILPPETKEEPALIKEEKKTEEKQPAKKKSKSFSGKKPRIALIIDDVGWNKEIVKEIEKINQPFTLAFLPKAQHSKEIFDSVKDNKNFDLLLHLPLEPSPPAQSFDKGLLKTSMDSQELIEQFNDDIDYYYPYIKGINNHMGSLFTTDEEKMKILLKEIKERNLFFIDSMTSRKSCGYLIAKDMGVKSGKRDVFIDNLSDHKYIEDQIWELVESAREKGSAIGIGHARKNTVAVLKNIMPSLTEQVEIVPVSELIE